MSSLSDLSHIRYLCQGNDIIVFDVVVLPVKCKTCVPRFTESHTLFMAVVRGYHSCHIIFFFVLRMKMIMKDIQIHR